MGESLTTSYNLTAAEIITETLELLTVIGPGMPANGEDYVSCLRSLNLMIKSWQAPPYGFHLWKVGKGYLFLNPGQKFYEIGGTSTDHIAEDAVVTDLAVALTTSATALTVDSTTGMTVGDVIGIELDAGTIHWTTIATIPTSTTLTITLGVVSAAAIDNKVYTYTSLAGRPLDITEVRLTKPGDTDQRMFPLSKNAYYTIANKTSESSPIQYYIETLKNSSRIYLYGTGNGVDEYIQFNYQKVVEDITLTTDFADFPPEVTMSIIWNLAIVVSPKYEKEDKAQGGLAGKAQELFQVMVDNDQENVPFKIVPNFWWYE